ncbi:uncharacterized protein BYT42DRAFT_491877, partial [Radiomyces spectabilis]|uniref:uncharacterized protein n=1 Tax=Radiomyces spectabilis TaxID=64574 RepID=UPI00221EBD39
MPDPRQVVFLVHRCFLDETHIKNYAEPRRLRDHLKDLHGFQFPVGLKSTRRYNTNGFLYLRHADSSERTRILYACPCCLGHYDSLNGVASHFFDEHTDYLP